MRTAPLSRRAARALLLVALAAGGCASSGDNDTTVPAPAAADREATATQLAQATAAQGVCYGWRLLAGSSVVSEGSNLGASTPVTADGARCDRWVEVQATVVYTAASSESEDWASVAIRTSPNLKAGAIGTDELDRLGLTNKAFIADPPEAVLRAALALPLLTVEAGAVEPLPATPTATPSGGVPELAAVRSDFWRDRLGYMVAAAALLLGGAVLITLALLAGRRFRARNAIRPRRPAPNKAGTT